jgi:carbonic anhydrase/acetyltransferase-like protein (isoleucine patch superfamily)
MGLACTVALWLTIVGAPGATAEPIEEASFVDPTATLVTPSRITLHDHVYVGPFAELRAERRSPIVIGEESNVQDNVRVEASASRGLRDRAAVSRLGLRISDGMQTGERVILAHGSSVRGPALLGVGEATAEDSGVFISFNAQVDGAIIERDSGLSALSRVGPGVRLRTGLIVLPGKNVTTQAEADDPALGKVRPITDADREFNAGVVEVNVGLAREYNRLQQDDPTAVYGINVDPGGNVFDVSRDAPTVESALCAGPEVRAPAFRNRLIGDVCFEDSLATLDAVLGSHISLRADEGGPFAVGTIERMHDHVVFHALEGSDLSLGNRIAYGQRTVVHGGGRPVLDPTTGVAAPTVVGNDVVFGDSAVAFRSLLRNGAVVGDRSAVVGSDLAVGQVIPPRTIYLNDEVFGPVEW